MCSEGKVKERKGKEGVQGKSKAYLNPPYLTRLSLIGAKPLAVILSSTTKRARRAHNSRFRRFSASA